MEGLTSSIVKVVRDKLTRAIVDSVGGSMPSNLRCELMDMNEMMEVMEHVLVDAERRATRDAAVRLLLAFGTWSTSSKSARGHRYMAGTHPCRLIRCTDARASKMNKMKQNLKIVSKDFQSFKFIKINGEHGMRQQSVDTGETLPFVYEEIIVGRDEDKQKIGMLLSHVSDSSEGLFIVPIVGLGGIGKTTLAKLVFTDTAQFRDYYRAWVTVSDEFYLKRIGNSIISQASEAVSNSITSQALEAEYWDSDAEYDVEFISKRLGELLGGCKKMLLVLDDIWMRDEAVLENLKCMLGSGNKDSKLIVIVTTRILSVARKLSTSFTYELGPLPDDMCWEILKQKSSFESREDRKEIEQIGREIARMCCGSPLPAHALGYMLRSMNPEEWLRVRDTMATESMEEGGILPFLALSYKCMPPNLKLCFAYFAIFPKGHKIHKDDLIHHWIALHLIESSDRFSAKVLAEKYIQILLGMSFLEPTMSDSTNREDDQHQVLFTMHDIVHDIALSVLGRDLIHLDSRYITVTPLETNYRYAVLTNLEARPLKLSAILSSTSLRALFFHNCTRMELTDDSFSSAKCLHVLDLRNCWMQRLPDSICQLRLLGYLNLSGCSRLSHLPESFGNLLHLEHINLSGCSKLVKLPESFGNLMSLVYIHLSGCSALLKLPDSVGKLTNVAHINLSGCSGLAKLPESFGRLKNLVYLNLSLCSCLEGIPSALGGLSNLQHLNLSHPCCYLFEHRFHLEGLKGIWGGLTKLQYLNLSMCLNPILCYLPEEEGLKHIQSISGLSNLEHLDLSHNVFLFRLPESLGQLVKLHTLDVSGCARLKRVDKWMGEMYSLKSIVVRNCRGLETYQFVVCADNETNSSNLDRLKDISSRKLEISCLEKVKSVDEAKRTRLVEKQKLEKLALSWTVDCHGTVEADALLAELVPPHNLQCFELHGYSGTCLPAWMTSSISSHLPNLVEVTMEDIWCRDCDQPLLGLLPNLQSLVLRRVPGITRIDAGDWSGGNRAAAFNRLSHFYLDDMENLEEFNVTYHNGEEELMFPAIDELVVQKCSKLRFRPFPPTAQRLLISESDKVMSLPQRGGHGGEGSSSSIACSTSTRVTELVVEKCRVPLGQWTLLSHLPGLHTLHLKNCDDLTSSSEITQSLSSIQSLCYSCCTERPVISSLENLVNLESLQELVIDGCHDIDSLPHSIIEKLGRLSRVIIRESPVLKEWCESRDKMTFAHVRLILE